MDNKYDVIVVGAGNGGLAAAANTSKAGLKTLVLEKHSLPGGCASSFVRGRFEFEPSLHELCSVGTAEKPDQIYKIFDNVGAKVNWQYEHDPYRAIFKDKDGNVDFDVRVRGGIQGYIDSIEEAVPGSRKSVTKMFELYDKIQAALAYITEMKGNPKPMTMITKHKDFMKVASHSVDEVLEALHMPQKARDIVNTYWGYLGVTTDDLNFMHYISMIVGYLSNDAAMPHDRSHEMSLALCDVIYKNGGQIFYNTPVTKFLFDENGKACGVVAGGKEYYAKEIISNIIPNSVYNMSDPKYIPQSDVKLANARNFGISVVTVYLGMDCSAEELGIKDYTVFVMKSGNSNDQHDHVLEEKGMYIVNCLNKVVPDATPEGTCSLFFTTLLYGKDLPKDLKPEDYKKWKNNLAKIYIDDYERITGMDIKGHIEEISIATPVTFARYLGTPDGTIYGYKTEGWDNVLLRTQADAKNADNTIKGLSFCGGHAFRGDGFSCAYITGEAKGKAAIKKIKGGNK